MEISHTRICDVPVFAVAGELDHQSSSMLRNALSFAPGSEGSRLVLDLRQCQYMDSGGLSVLFDMVVQTAEADGWTGVLGPNARIRRLLELVGLVGNDSFVVLDDEEHLTDFVCSESFGGRAGV